MRMLGLLGGMSWNSTELYYRWINEAVAAAKGGLHSAPLLIHSVDFGRIAPLQQAGDWAGTLSILSEAALGLKRGGAEAITICTNTMHKLAPQLAEITQLPVLHIGDAVAVELKARGIDRAGILGTRFTMQLPFYAEYFRQHHGISLLAPDAPSQDEIHRVIYEELCCGIVSDRSREAYLSVIANLRTLGAQAVILGCTEICLLLSPEAHPDLNLIDSTRLHAQQAAQFILG